MRRKIKLSFEALELEFSKISNFELLNIVGGGNVNSIENAIKWANSVGVPFTVDGKGEYKDPSGHIFLSPVDVYAWSTNNNPFQNPITTAYYEEPTENQIINSYVRYFESLGYEMIQNDDGSYYCASQPYVEPPLNNPSQNDPWKRDANGNIIAEKTNAEKFIYNTYGDNLLMEEYVIFTEKGAPIKAYKAIGVVDSNGKIIRQATENERSNCMGYALTGGEYTFIDNPNTTSIYADEGKITRSSFSQWSGYTETTNKSEASLVLIYMDGQVIHAGNISPDGTYSAKGGGGDFEIRKGMTEAEFYKPYPNSHPNLNYNGGTIVYYK